MSLGYADRLSFREDLGGRLGDPELQDSDEEVARKVALLASWVQEASSIIAFTGAGISTACGIPDFRGPNGVWTCQRAERPPPRLTTSFVAARPSLTHQALVALDRAGKLRYTVSQNVDGLHLRSGLPGARLAELHGNCFAERCGRCERQYVRDFEMDSVGFKYTGRKCDSCGGRLKDFILDWEDALPDPEFEAAKVHASAAGVALCLGTSLQITPACNLPLRTAKAGGRLVIVNLQATPKDKRADLVIHARCEVVMGMLLAHLNVAVPPYVRTDSFVLSHELGSPEGGSGSGGPQRVSISLSGTHGPSCPMPIVDSVEFSYPEEPELGSISVAAPPYRTHRIVEQGETLRLLVQLRFNEAADPDKRLASTEYCVSLAPRGAQLPCLGAALAVAEAPQADRVSPTEAVAVVPEAAALGRRRRLRGELGKSLAVAPRGNNGVAGLEPMQQTVVQFVTQELKYELPSVRDLKVACDAVADAETPNAKRKRQ